MSAETSNVRAGVTYCIKVFLALRIGLFILGFLAATTFPARTIVTAPEWPQQPVSPGLTNIVTSFERQDATWYLQIATTGYKPNDGSAAFFPLYPMAIRGVSTAIGGHPLGAAYLVSNGALLAAIILLYFLTASELSESEAKRTILYLMVFPAAFFFFAPYTESLFLLCIVTSFWGARRKKWAVAGLVGMLAALTRSVGVFLVPALAIEALLQWREAKRAGTKDDGTALRTSFPIGALLWSAVPAIGTLLYLSYWKSQGDWAIPLRLQQYWERHPEWPWITLFHAFTVAWHDMTAAVSGYTLLDLVIAVPMLVAAVVVVKWFRPSYAVFTWLCILAPLCMVFEPRPLMSVPRFLLPLFPLFWAGARATERHRLPQTLVVGASAAGLGLMTALFVNSYYVF